MCNLQSGMVLNKLSSGMTLIMVMFALAVAGSILTPIFIAQASFIQRITHSGMAIHRNMIAEQFLYENEFKLLQQQEPITQKKHTKPALKLIFTQKKPAQNSALARFKNVELREVSVRWVRDGIAKEDRIMTIAYKPEEHVA